MNEKFQDDNPGSDLLELITPEVREEIRRRADELEADPSKALTHSEMWQRVDDLLRHPAQS